MPYRITINSDAARSNFLDRCSMQAQNDAAANNLIIEEDTLAKMNQISPKFKEAVIQRGKEAADQIPAVAQKEQAKSTVIMWISHFLQVLDFWVIRELHDDGTYKYYGMDVSGPAVPPIRLDDEALYWGNQLILGEAKRVAEGGIPMNNPSINGFKPVFEDYKHKLQLVQKEKTEANDAEKVVDALRPVVDEIIDDAISEMEYKLRKLDAPGRRRRMRTYGVTFAYRPGEPEDEEPPAPEAANTTAK